jgi:hypothetical protein
MSNKSKRSTGPWSEAARAKAAATRAANKKLKQETAATVEGAMALSMIPDKPERKTYTRKTKGTSGDTRQQVVLALLKYLNGE